MPPYRIPGSGLLSQPALHQLLAPRQLLPKPQFSRARNLHSSSATRPFSRLSHLARPSTFRSGLRRPNIRQQIRHNSSPPSKPVSPDITPSLGSPEPTLTLSQRMRKLSREYGWAAFGVYMGLSALDFPFCFLAVRALGTERIGHWEHAIVTTVKQAVAKVIPFGAEAGEQAGEVKEEVKEKVGAKKEGEEDWDWGVEEAQKAANKDNATLWTQLVLAYAIHKSFIFIRVPLTVAVTPKVVKTLRGWGWNIGKRPTKKTLPTTTTPPKSS